MRKNLFFIPATLLLAAAVTWKVFAAPAKKKINTEDILLVAPDEQTETEAEPEQELAEGEKEILEILRNMLDGFGDTTSYSYARFIYSYTNPAANNENISNLEMKWCVKKDSMFYETKDVVITNTNSLYVNVIKEQKRIVIAPGKTFSEMPDIPLKMAGKFYKSNGYTMEKTVNDSTARIRIYNANHLNCKEMLIDYDPELMKPVQVTYTMPDIEDPFNEKLDKTMQINVKEWVRDEQEVKRISFPATIQLKDNSFIPVAAYKGYGMINLTAEQ
jgi:hypothetical protein